MTLPIDPIALSQSLAHSELLVRMHALAQLAQYSQLKVRTFFAKRGISGDQLEDLMGEVSLVLTNSITQGKYQHKDKDPMCFVYRVAYLVLQHYYSRDSRVTGKIVTIEDEDEYTFTGTDELAHVENKIDQELFYGQLMERLHTPTDRQVATLLCQDQRANEIAETLKLNIKTVRTSMKRIGAEVLLLCGR